MKQLGSLLVIVSLFGMTSRAGAESGSTTTTTTTTTTATGEAATVKKKVVTADDIVKGYPFRGSTVSWSHGLARAGRHPEISHVLAQPRVLAS